MKYSVLNGEIILREKINVSPGDLGITRGVGMFDFLRASGTAPLYLTDHLARLNRGMESMGFGPAPDLSHVIREMLVLNDHSGMSGIRILVTGGTDFSLKHPQIVITQEEITPPSVKEYEEGAALLMDEYLRELPEVKSTNYLNAVMLYREMVDFGACDILYHSDGLVTECARSNFFIVKDGEIITASQNVLQGITRKQLLEIAKVRVEDITLNDVRTCDEVFITSTIKRILPVSRIYSVEKEWKPGPVTKGLMEQLAERDKKEITI